MSGEEYERLIEWINDPDRKPPALAFTAGSLRTAVDAIVASGVLKRCTELEAEVERLKASLKETLDACSAGMRVLADIDAATIIGVVEDRDTRMQRFIEELKYAGVTDGFGRRARDVLGLDTSPLETKR